MSDKSPEFIVISGDRNMTLNQALDQVPRAYEREGGWWLLPEDAWELDIQLTSIRMSMGTLDYKFIVREV